MQLFYPQEYRFILKWLVYWLSVMGGYAFILKPLGFTYYNKWFGVFSYFIFFSYIGIVFFWRPQEKFNFKKNLINYFVIILFYMLSSLSLNFFFPLSSNVIFHIKKLGILFTYLTFGTLLSKLADVFFQQVLIIGMVYRLSFLRKQVKVVMLAFCLIFFILHLPLFFLFGIEAFIFILPSLFAGGFFAWVLLKFKYGISYSLAVHLSFYCIAAYGFRLYYNG